MAKTKEALKILEKVTGSEATMRGGVAKARINLAYLIVTEFKNFEFL